ncbi:putative family 31 glucosidase, partial [Stegodyphus mimosarum]
MKLLLTQHNKDKCETDSMTCHVVSCHKVQWTFHLTGAMDCFILGDDLWYGNGVVISQRWPLQSDSKSWYPAVTGDPLHHPAGNVMENLWISSGGFAIYVEHEVPLFVSFNESGNGKLCFSTSYKKHPYHNGIKSHPQLVYSICSAMSVKEVYSYVAHRWLKKPVTIPDEMMFEYPVWSTWARYKQNISEATILKFATEIQSYGFPASQLEIDDKWESCYGDLDFDIINFPNPKKMVNDLKELGFPTTLWVHPFCNIECKTYKIGEENGYWVKNNEGQTLLFNWWNGEAAAIDTTNRKAVEWFVNRLKNLQSVYGIEAFKFDAGEVLWLASNFTFHDEKSNLQPNIYSRSYAELAAQFGGKVEVRIGYESQHLPVFVRMFDKFSHWDYANGLQTIIPSALHLSLLGYNFILPDMIGGNNYNSPIGSLPDKELYIRWLEACIFLPAIQFSITPWDYDDEVVNISRKMVALHEKYSSHILTSAIQATETGEPIIRPLWWIAPEDIVALSTDSQFLVGDGIMIAPVLEWGKKKRDIYLPEGKWTDGQTGKSFEGSQWLYEYKAPLNILPFFIRHS